MLLLKSLLHTSIHLILILIIIRISITMSIGSIVPLPISSYALAYMAISAIINFQYNFQIKENYFHFAANQPLPPPEWVAALEGQRVGQCCRGLLGQVGLGSPESSLLVGLVDHRLYLLGIGKKTKVLKNDIITKQHSCDLKF